MNEIEKNLKSEFARAASGVLQMDLGPESVELSLPREKAHGDYATNIAMKYAKKAGMNPREAASRIAEAFDLEKAGADHIEIAGPGFMNVFMKHDSLQGVIRKVLERKDDYGCSNHGQGKKYNLEYVSANPTGDLHPGHARGAASVIPRPD